MNKEHPESIRPVLADTAETNCAGRQKYWSELKEHERIDRLREVVKRQSRLINELEDLVGKLWFHSHDASGAPVQKLAPSNQEANIYQSAAKKRAYEDSGDDVYF